MAACLASANRHGMHRGKAESGLDSPSAGWFEASCLASSSGARRSGKPTSTPSARCGPRACCACCKRPRRAPRATRASTPLLRAHGHDVADPSDDAHRREPGALRRRPRRSARGSRISAASARSASTRSVPASDSSRARRPTGSSSTARTDVRGASRTNGNGSSCRDARLPSRARRFRRAEAPADATTLARRIELHELDALRHVNNSNYVSYLEQAALDALRRPGWGLDAQLAAGGRLPGRRTTISNTSMPRSTAKRIAHHDLADAGQRATASSGTPTCIVAMRDRPLLHARSRYDGTTGDGEVAAMPPALLRRRH